MRLYCFCLGANDVYVRVLFVCKHTGTLIFHQLYSNSMVPLKANQLKYHKSKEDRIIQSISFSNVFSKLRSFSFFEFNKKSSLFDKSHQKVSTGISLPTSSIFHQYILILMGFDGSLIRNSEKMAFHIFQ